jgi:hypothetical protein
MQVYRTRWTSTCGRTSPRFHDHDHDQTGFDAKVNISKTYYKVAGEEVDGSQKKNPKRRLMGREGKQILDRQR